MDGLMWLAMAMLGELFPGRPGSGVATTDCLRVAPMPVGGLHDTAMLTKRHPLQVIRIDSATLKRMHMPVDRRVPCYQLDSTSRR